MKKKAIGVLIVLAILYVFGFRVTHPVDGLTSAMGSAKSSLVIYRASGEYSVGQKVVVTVAGQGSESGIVKAATKETVDVDTRSAFVRVKQDEVHGRLLLVVPFFGTLLGFFGL